MNSIVLFIGAVTWQRSERVSDRYGMIYPTSTNSGDDSVGAIEKPIEVMAIHAVAGKKGKLIAKVLEARESTHIGDLFHGYAPQTPNVGDEILLGTGLLRSEMGQDSPMVGVEPINPRKDGHWMNARNLYKVHEQTCEIRFEYKE